MQAVIEAISDAELRSKLRNAASGRISHVILSAPGLYAVRWLAALALTTVKQLYGEECGPHDALALIIKSIEDRIGNRPAEWINSLAVIGQRLIGAGYDTGFGQSLYERNVPTKEGR